MPTDDRPDGDRVSASHVHFAYPQGEEVLHDVSLAPRVGERVAVVGPSGSGKSTLGRLLAGISVPTAGRVTVGGVDASALPTGVLRGEVALVSQEHHVFVGTVAENLRLAAPDADDRRLQAALDTVEASGWAHALPYGWATRVGSGGATLTPAQSQQLALARLVLLDPHTVVLDEATSLLDPRSARSVERAVGRFLRGRTVIAIAHRLHTARDADRIVVLRDGSVTETGTHRELVSRGGDYAQLWQAWSDGAAA